MKYPNLEQLNSFCFSIITTCTCNIINSIDSIVCLIKILPHVLPLEHIYQRQTFTIVAMKDILTSCHYTNIGMHDL